MSHARVETSVPRHPKFLRAGPAASWLWLAGVCYCQDALTDGFISKEAIHALGVLKPLPLAAVLVRERLWHEEEDGWRIHDYLEHNNSAEYITRVRQDRKAAGQKGGRSKHPLIKAVNQLDKQVAWDVLEQLPEQAAKQSLRSSFNEQRSTVPVRRTAARPQRGPEFDPDPNDHYAVITAVVTKDILPRRRDDHTLMADTMQRCDELGVAHTADVVRKAIDSALFRYCRALRLEHGLPPDPRGIYHDHVRPKMTRATLTSTKKRPGKPRRHA